MRNVPSCRDNFRFEWNILFKLYYCKWTHWVEAKESTAVILLAVCLTYSMWNTYFMISENLVYYSNQQQIKWHIISHIHKVEAKFIDSHHKYFHLPEHKGVYRYVQIRARRLLRCRFSRKCWPVSSGGDSGLNSLSFLKPFLARRTSNYFWYG